MLLHVLFVYIYFLLFIYLQIYKNHIFFYIFTFYYYQGFPGGSTGKASACNEGDPGLTPGSGRCPGEETGCPLQYSWASLVAQLLKNPTAMWETWIRSLGWEDSLEKRMAIHSSILTWTVPWAIQWMGSQKVRHNWVTFIFISPFIVDNAKYI